MAKVARLNTQENNNLKVGGEIVMQTLYRFLEDNDGQPVPKDDQVWHVLYDSDTSRSACGDAVDACGIDKFETKTVKRGGITCKECLAVIKQFKAIKL